MKLRKKKILPIVMLGYGKYFITKGMLLGCIDRLSHEILASADVPIRTQSVSEMTKLDDTGVL